MSKITAIQNPAKRQASSEEKAWAVAALRRAAKLGRLPRKSDFDPQEAQRIKDYLGPWPRALEAAGLKEVPERIAKKTEMKKDLLIVLAVLAVLTVFLLTTDFQTVDQYYLTHIDDITPDSETVTISIRCDQILQNYDKLDKALQSEEYVPADGMILPKTTYVLREGDTVFNILDRTARYNKIQLEYQGADRNLLGTVYIQGIHYLYEFSCGAGSGWVYSVNGQFPNCGCGEYVLSDGDEIVWYYTCNLGRDVGAIPEGGRE